MKICHTHILNS